jgi:hypothetical protein
MHTLIVVRNGEMEQPALCKERCLSRAGVDILYHVRDQLLHWFDDEHPALILCQWGNVLQECADILARPFRGSHVRLIGLAWSQNKDAKHKAMLADIEKYGNTAGVVIVLCQDYMMEPILQTFGTPLIGSLYHHICPPMPLSVIVDGRLRRAKRLYDV